MTYYYVHTCMSWFLSWDRLIQITYLQVLNTGKRHQDERRHDEVMGEFISICKFALGLQTQVHSSLLANRVNSVQTRKVGSSSSHNFVGIPLHLTSL